MRGATQGLEGNVSSAIGMVGGGYRGGPRHLFARSGGGPPRFHGGGWRGVGIYDPRGRRRGRVWARSAFRLRGSLGPRNGRAIYLRDRQGCRNFTRSKGGLGQVSELEAKARAKGLLGARDLQVGDDGTHPVAGLGDCDCISWTLSSNHRGCCSMASPLCEVNRPLLLRCGKFGF